MRAAVVAALGLALVPLAAASHPSWALDRKLNVGGDRAPERVLATHDVSLDHRTERAKIEIVDRCGGRRVKHILHSLGRMLDRELILQSPALGRPGLVYAVSFRGGRTVARVVQLRPRPGSDCPGLVQLFDYTTERPPTPPPARLMIAGVSVRVRDVSASFPGRELRLTERYAASPSGPVQATRESDFGYSRAKGAYRRIRSVLRN